MWCSFCQWLHCITWSIWSRFMCPLCSLLRRDQWMSTSAWFVCFSCHVIMSDRWISTSISSPSYYLAFDATSILSLYAFDAARTSHILAFDCYLPPMAWFYAPFLMAKPWFLQSACGSLASGSSAMWCHWVLSNIPFAPCNISWSSTRLCCQVLCNTSCDSSCHRVLCNT